MTSVGRGGEGSEAHQAGAEAYLTKPVRQSQLYDALATVMAKEEEAAAPEEEAAAEEQEEQEEQKEEEEKKQQLVTSHSLREAKASSRTRILVAEDNQVNQKVAVRMLERLGYRADVAANGLEALEALSRIRYSAVLMDVQMPEMDGYEATGEIRRREQESDRHTPIIAMTANAMQGDRENALGAGMDDYVSKPVKPEELGTVLKRWVRELGAVPSALEEETGGAAAPPVDTTDLLDRSVLEGLRELQEEGEPDILNELIELFLDDVPPQLVVLREAVVGGNADSVERVAHTLKGSCGNMGAIRMAKVCEQLQEVGASEDLMKAPTLLDQLEAEFDRVRTAFEAERLRNQY